MRRQQFFERWGVWLMLAPALLVILVLFSGGLVMGAAQSLGYMPVIGMNDLTLDYYRAVLTDPVFLISLWVTFRIAFVSTLLATIFAVLTALALRETFRGSRITTFFYQVPIPIPHLVVAFGIVALVSQSGIGARMAAALGLISEPSQFPVLVFDRPSVGIQLVYLWKEIPFIGLVVLAVLKSVGPEYEELAQTLGANRWQRFRFVLLPLIMPGILSTSIIVFAFVFASYEIPLLLGVRFPTTLPVLAFELYQDTNLRLRPEAMAISIVLTVISILLLYSYRRLARYALR
jgi:putative spermidine/putrescine transport system permease protein